MRISVTWRRLAEAMGVSPGPDDENPSVGHGSFGSPGRDVSKMRQPGFTPDPDVGSQRRPQYPSQMPGTNPNQTQAPAPTPTMLQAPKQNAFSQPPGNDAAVRGMDPGVKRGTGSASPSPGLARAPNADSQDRTNSWDKASGALGPEDDGQA